MSEKMIYSGLSFVTYDGEPFDLGYGITVSSTYAHLFSAQMMAFERAESGAAHSAPWRAAKGGFQYDIEVEVSVPTDAELPGQQSAEDTVWLIAALLRLIKHAYLVVPVISNHAFRSAENVQDPILTPFEQEPRILHPPENRPVAIDLAELEWVKSIWPRTAKLLNENKSFCAALKAADSCTASGMHAPMLLTAWSALEELFSPARVELKFRISTNIAAYLEPIGSKRLDLFKAISTLYDARSKAAHTASGASNEEFVGTFVILRNAPVKMIDIGVIPTASDFEKLIFTSEES